MDEIPTNAEQQNRRQFGGYPSHHPHGALQEQEAAQAEDPIQVCTKFIV